MSFNITPVASGYQEIHPYSAMNIDSVKINTSLIMMKEWEISLLSQHCLHFLSFAFVLGRLSKVLHKFCGALDMYMSFDQYKKRDTSNHAGESR